MVRSAAGSLLLSIGVSTPSRIVLCSSTSSLSRRSLVKVLLICHCVLQIGSARLTAGERSLTWRQLRTRSAFQFTFPQLAYDRYIGCRCTLSLCIVD